MSTSAFERDENKLTPIIAVGLGFNDGANKGFWRVQPRQQTGRNKGQWIEMGAELRAYYKDALGKAASVSGRALGSDGTPNGVRVLITGQADKGIPDGIYGFNTKNVRVAEALLPEEYLESQGLAPTIPGDIDMAALPNIDEIERADITPDDIRLANEGINSPEGQQQAAFKNTPEGQEIARLDEETAANVQQGLETPTGDKALERLGYTKTGVEPDGSEEWSSQAEIDDATGNPSMGVSKQPDGTWEATNYYTGEIFPGKTKDDAIGAFYEANRDATPEEIAAAKAEEEAKAAQAEADRQAAMAPKLTKDEFVNSIMDSIEYRAESTGERPSFPSKEALDEAYNNYSSDYDMARSNNEDVDYDYNQMLKDDATAELLDDTFPLSQFRREMDLIDEQDSAQQKADDIVSRAMRDEDIDLNQELDEFLQDPDEVIPEDIDLGPEQAAEAVDPEFNMEAVAKSAIDADEVAIDDFVDDEDDDFIKVTGVDIDEDGNWEITGLDRNGEERSIFGNRRDRVRRIDEFADPNEEAPARVPATPAMAPAPAAQPKAEMPENATPVGVWDIKPGDVLYDRSGNKLGTVESAARSGSFANPNKSAEVVLLGDDGSKSKRMLMDSQRISRVAAPEPEKPKTTAVDSLNSTLPEGFKAEGNDDSFRVTDASGKTIATAVKRGDGRYEVNLETGTGRENTKPGTLEDARDILGGHASDVKNGIFEEPAPAPQVAEEPELPPEEPKGEVARQGLIEDLTPGTLFWDNSGKQHNVTKVTNNNGKVTVDYIDENGEAKSKRFREGTPVDLQPNDVDNIPVSREFTGKPATQEQKDQIAEFDEMDSEEPITDEDLRDRLMSAYNMIQDGVELDEGELQDLIDELQNHFTGESGASKGGNTYEGRRVDDGQNIPAPELSPEEMRMAKTGRAGSKKNDPDEALDLLAEHYPGGGFISNPNDALNGGFVARRDDIDGGTATLETIVLRTIGNKFQVWHRITDKRTGAVTTVAHYKNRESYAAIHSPAYGLDTMHDYLSGNTSPIDPKSSSRYRRNFEPGKPWSERLKYWRTDKVRLDEATMNDVQRERLNRDFNGDVDAMAEALRIQSTKLRTPEEMFSHLANGQDEKLNKTTDYILNNKMRSAVPSFFAALESGSVDFAKARYQEMMNMIPELSPELKKAFIKVLRRGLTARMNATGTTGKQRTRALQVFSAAVTNYIKHADKQWSIDNDLKLPHVSGTGVKVAKKGDIATWQDNEGNTFTGRIVSLRRKSGPNGYNDFVRMQFKDKDGRVKTLNTDLNAKNIKLQDAGVELDEINFGDARWKRLGDLAWNRGFTEGGIDQAQEDTDIKKAGRLARGKKWVDPSDPRYNPNLGSDGVEGDDDEAEDGKSFVIPKSGSKPASELIPGDTIYGTDGSPLGTITAVKMTSKNGQPIMAIKFRDAEGNTKTIAYGVDQMVGPNERGGDDNPKG